MPAKFWEERQIGTFTYKNRSYSVHIFPLKDKEEVYLRRDDEKCFVLGTLTQVTRDADKYPLPKLTLNVLQS